MLGGTRVGPVFVTLFLLAAPGAGAEQRQSALVAKLMSSVVCVVGEVPEGRFEASGFVVAPGGRVLTTAHGIAGVRHLQVKLHGGRRLEGELEHVGDERADLALVRFEGRDLEPLRLGSIADIMPGDEVFTIGCPSDFEFSVTRGVVSSVRSSDLGYPLIQTDVPVSPGSSGGPLFDRDGHVIGIVKSSAAGRDRIHFALPADLAKALLTETDRQQRARELFSDAIRETRTEEKVRIYREVIGLAPELSEAHYNLALALDRQGDLPAAEAEYRATLRLLPDYSPAALNLGTTLYRQQRFPEAIDVYQAALGQSPDSPALRNNLAEAYRAVGKTQDAKRELEAILEKHPAYASAHYGLALLYEDDLGDPGKAAEHYRRYLALDPEAQDAQEVRDWLQRAEAGR